MRCMSVVVNHAISTRDNAIVDVYPSVVALGHVYVVQRSAGRNDCIHNLSAH